MTRLLDMGLEPFNVASALNLVLAQRLVRRICNNCKTHYAADPDEMRALKIPEDATFRSMQFTEEAVENAKKTSSKHAKPFSDEYSFDTRLWDLTFFKGTGCDACNGSGLKGRQGIYEVMAMTQRLRKLILQNMGVQELKEAAVQEGMLTLRMDGLLKIMKGITTVEQVVRETSS